MPTVERFVHHGIIIPGCPLPGETIADGVVAAHPNGLRLSRRRWLLVYATRQFRGNDDDCSIVYQIRADSPNGDVLTERLLAQSISDWQPAGTDGPRYVKQHGSPSCFGVPKGATIDGTPAAAQNLFVIKWRRVAREFDAATNRVEGTDVKQALVRATQVVEYCQVRLNPSEDDLEMVQPPQPLRQVGYEEGPQPGALADCSYLRANKVSALPYDSDATEWVEVMGFDRQRYAAIKWRFDAEAGRYRWVQTGPPLFATAGRHVAEAELAACRDGWAVAARTDFVKNHVRQGSGTAWLRMDDPFGEPPEPVFPAGPPVASPTAVFGCADGVLRYFGGGAAVSPHGNDRDPLLCWDIDPDRGFAASGQRVLFDTVAAGLPFRAATAPKVDMVKLLPADGDTQFLLHRVSCISNAFAHVHLTPHLWVFPRINEQELRSCAIYGGHFRYDQAAPAPAPWHLA